jgi:predicted dehydrogenase
MKLKTAFIGFGKSTTRYHLPYVLRRDNIEVTAVYNRRRKPELEENYKEYNIEFTDNLQDILDNKEILLVSVCSPLQTHYEYAKKCLEAGKNVLVEKPFTASIEEAKELFKLAKEKGLVIMPYQNRRFDSDFLLFKEALKNKNLGEIVEVESHFDRFRPDEKVKPGTPIDGVFWGLGSHALDQIISVFGKPEKVYYDIRSIRDKEKPDDYYHIELFYDGFKAVVKSSHLVLLEYPKFIIQGKNGSFIKYGIDKQEEYLKAGTMPWEKGFGEEPEENSGQFAYIDNGGRMRKETMPVSPGDYGRIYDSLYEAILNKKEKLVSDEEALTVLEILMTGIKSENPKIREFK